MPDKNELIVEEDGPICSIVFNRPEKRNLLTPGMLLGIEKALNRLREEGKTRCVVIRGAGDRAFSSGYDIGSIGKDDMIKNHSGENPLPRAVRSIERFPYPVIAMLNGHAFGAGLEIAATCDIRTAAKGCQLGMPPAKLGVIYSYRGVKTFLNLIGPGYTKELFLTGRPVDSERAERIGLVNFTLPASDLVNFTYEIAREITENAPLSLKGLKEMVNVWQRNQIIRGEDEELLRKLTLSVQESEDYKEGQRSFAEKRKPVFKGE
ncbi:MAG TPA: enoyl-CoA hydratase-related protein [Thermodesulfobacteriota bacterium]|nr:enoyl-CoA hydratase-related protein [Thermodesulfobacteriota bacterium]